MRFWLENTTTATKTTTTIANTFFVRAHRKLLRRNCFIGVALDVRNTPIAGGGPRWASAGEKTP